MGPAVVLGVFCTWARLAWSQPAAPGTSDGGALALAWDAPASCPSAEAFTARVRRRLDGRAPGPPAAIAARITTSPSGYALTLDASIGNGAPTRRGVVGSSCEELADAAALIVAVAVDPVFVVAETVVAPVVPEVTATAVGPAPPPSPARSPDTVDAARPRPGAVSPVAPRGIGVGLRAGAGAWFGALPRVGPTIAVDVVIGARRSLRAEIGALAIVRQRTTVAPGAGAELWLATAVVRGCFAPAVGRVRPTACLGVTAGALGGRGRGVAVQSTAAIEPWVSATIATGLGVSLTRRLELVARVEGHVHARRPGFHLDAVGPVHRVAPTSVTALAGLQAVLP